MQNETQFLINTIVIINIKKFQQFVKIDFSRPLTLDHIRRAFAVTFMIYKMLLRSKIAHAYN